MIRFGQYEVRSSTRELFRNGVRVKLPPQAFEVLRVLVEHRGELVTRQQFHSVLWPADTFVDFDQGLNNAIKRIREVLNDSSGAPKYIETLPRLGYRFIAEIESAPAIRSTPESYPVEPRKQERPPGAVNEAKPGQWRSIWIGVSACLIGLGLTYATLKAHRPARKVRSVAILRLRSVSADPNTDYFAEGMSQELATELGRSPELHVVSDTSSSSKREDSPVEVGRTLGVEAVVEGTVLRSGDKFQIDIGLIDVRSSTPIWKAKFEDSTREAMKVQHLIASEIAAHAHVLLTPSQKPRSTRVDPLEPAAFDGYLQGRYLLNKRDANGAVQSFRRAVVLDPEYAKAWAGLSAGLADSAMGSEDAATILIPEARAAAKHAIELDPDNGEAWSVLGQIAFNSDWDWNAAEYDLKQAVSLSPNDSTTELRYAILLSIVGRHAEAVNHMHRALYLDPLSFYNVRMMGSILYWSRRYDEALQYLQRAQEMEPDLGTFTAGWVSQAYEMKGMREQAVLALYRPPALGDPKPAPNPVEQAYRRGGRVAFWRALLKAKQSADHGPCRGFETALINARLGETDEVLKGLNSAYKERCFALATVNADPFFDQFRSDPQFKDLQAKLNLLQ